MTRETDAPDPDERDDGGEDLADGFAPEETTEVLVQVDEALAGGTYCNLAFVAATETELSLDFAFRHHGEPTARLQARVLLSPKVAKRLARELAAHVAEYERRHGAVGG